MTHRIAVIAGDGAGPEVVAEARKCVDALALDLTWEELPWGTAHYHEQGVMMPPDALDVLRGFDAVLLGAVGDPSVPDHVTLWGLLLPLRQGLDLWANLRPARLLDGIPSKLDGRPPVDMLFVRENTEGEYSGVGGRAHQGLDLEVGIETSVFTRAGVRRVVKYAFELAEKRRGVVTSATKSNASRYGYVLWDEVAEEVAAEHPGVKLERVLVDALAARMVSNPGSLDVVVASNLFGDVLTDIAAVLQGGMGMAASASLAPGSDTTPVFEPVHGSAHDIAGKGLANPVGAIWSAALMLDALDEAEASARLMRALEDTCREGPRTVDVGGDGSTSQVGDASRTKAPMNEWWRSAVFYEIYVRSFADSNDDGVGDLPGITQHLPYLRDLGVDAIWLTPFYPSPGVDHGYDVADYVDVDPLFGTLADFDELLAAAHALELHVVVDIVPNHTSSEHPWFTGERSRYVTVPGAEGELPNNWPSVWGGPAWTYDAARGEHYLHFFAPEQPDLDWHNMQVRADFEEILRFWLDRGVDGFRIDVAHALVKDAGLADEPEPIPVGPMTSEWRTAVDRPEVHDVYRDWRRLADCYDGERVFVGEVFFTDPSRIAPYLRSDELQLAFNFSLVFEEWDVAAIRGTIEESLAALPIVTWVLESHDVARIVTRYGAREARAAALLLLALPGPVFLYQGQELGLEEVDLPDELRQDPVFKRSGGTRKGRDGCRVPIPWERTLPRATWLPQPPSWGELSVEAQLDDTDSMLSLYRLALRRRPSGGFRWLDRGPGVLAFERKDVTCVVNFGPSSVALPPGRIEVASDRVEHELPPSTAAWIR